MARSKRIKRAFDLHKQLRHATRQADTLAKKYTEHVASMPENERAEFLKLKDNLNESEEEKIWD